MKSSTALASVLRGDIGPDTGAVACERIVIAMPVHTVIGRKLHGYGSRAYTTEGAWLVAHPFPSPYDGENTDGHADYRFEKMRIAVIEHERFERRFVRKGDDRLRFYDNEVTVWVQQMSGPFEATVKSSFGDRLIRGKKNDHLVQLHAPGDHSVSSFTAMQFVVSNTTFLWQHFIQKPS